MIFFTVKEILISVLIFSAAGFAFGALYMASGAIFSSFFETLLIIPKAFKNISNFGFGTRAIKRVSKKHGALFEGFFDFFIFLIFGVFYIIINYLALDGVFRFYSLIFTVIFFCIAKITVGKGFAVCYGRAYDLFYGIAFTSVSVILLPIYKLWQRLRGIFKKLVSPLVKKFGAIRQKRLTRKKLNQIDLFFKKAGLTN